MGLNAGPLPESRWVPAAILPQLSAHKIVLEASSPKFADLIFGHFTLPSAAEWETKLFMVQAAGAT
jgi:hypothetical protein